ncbi:hypothetical protein [Marisediminicola sp. LYQ134]|uniref:hypothetical protein n=1 Tax=Marisediminicola sp. LYQ134 TaxID=3391061 RepID=UPI003983D6F8
MTTAEIGGLTFQGTRQPNGLHFRRIIDWDSLPESKNQEEDRPNDHGSFGGGEDFRRGATTSIEGWFQGEDREEALLARRQILGALQGQDRRITVTDELGPTSRDVSVRRVTLGDIFGFRFEISVDMFAKDPRRYGPEVPESTGIPVAGGGLQWQVGSSGTFGGSGFFGGDTIFGGSDTGSAGLVWPITWESGGSDGRITVENDGNADTYSLLEITGGLEDGFSAVEVGTGREIRFERFIDSASTVYLNPRTGAAYIDEPGNDVSGYLTRADWFSIPPGGTSVIQFFPLGTVTGTPTLTARTAPAFW